MKTITLDGIVKYTKTKEEGISILENTTKGRWHVSPPSDALILKLASFEARAEGRHHVSLFIRESKTMEVVETIRPVKAEGALYYLSRYVKQPDHDVLRWQYHSTDRPEFQPERPRVYFIQAVNGGPIKIGFTAEDVRARCKQLQTGNPYELKVLAWCHAPQSKEKELHKQFASARLEGEWFAPVPELLALILSLRGVQ